MKISIKLIELDNEYIANCPELDINCYAHSRDEAIKRIVNVLKFYIDSAKELGLQIESFDLLSIEGIISDKIVLNDLYYISSDSIN